MKTNRKLLFLERSHCKLKKSLRARTQKFQKMALKFNILLFNALLHDNCKKFVWICSKKFRKFIEFCFKIFSKFIVSFKNRQFQNRQFRGIGVLAKQG